MLLFSQPAAGSRVSQPLADWPARCCNQRSSSAGPSKQAQAACLATNEMIVIATVPVITGDRPGTDTC